MIRYRRSLYLGEALGDGGYLLALRSSASGYLAPAGTLVVEGVEALTEGLILR